MSENACQVALAVLQLVVSGGLLIGLGFVLGWLRGWSVGYNDHRERIARRDGAA